MERGEWEGSCDVLLGSGLEMEEWKVVEMVVLGVL